jgi:hypothetical protein
LAAAGNHTGQPLQQLLQHPHALLLLLQQAASLLLQPVLPLLLQ